ncbi:MAG: outer membrane beta-barrel protein [Candidatus Aegiribacteria sp.]|nr:outer membrane beta-barrel protein [Candidatus Aegiribacteria sp.]
MTLKGKVEMKPTAAVSALFSQRANFLRKAPLLILFSLLLFTFSAYAATTGIVGGFVLDTNGNPLVGATVMIEDTYLGAMTDASGEYIIAGVTPGNYSVTASMVGRSTSRMEGVLVIADQLSRIDFNLPEDPTGSTIITVRESRNHILQDVPATLHLMDFTEIRTITSKSIVDVVADQPGVITSHGEVHVRGGRSGEVDYLFDGVSIRSPISNKFNLELPLGAISNASLMTGGLGVEYGNSMSGVVNLIGKEGADSYHGSLILRHGDITTASFQSGKQLFMEETDVEQCRSNLNGIEGSVSGPEPITEKLLPSIGIRIPGQMRFSASGQISLSGRDTLDTRSSWENNWQSDMSGVAKLTYRPLNRTSFALTFLGSSRETGWNEWAWSRYHLPAYIDGAAYLGRSQDYALPILFSETAGITFNASQLLGSETCLKLTMSIMKFQDWNRIRRQGGGYIGENTNPTYWFTQYQPEERITDSLGFYHTGTHPNVWFDSKAKVSSIMVGFDSNPNTRARIKAGVSGNYYDLYQYNVYAETFGNIFISQWDAYPHSGSCYLQGSYRFGGGVITTAGLRADMFNANTSVFVSETGDNVRVKTKWHISPRVGFSVPFSETSVFFSTYGHHFQMPSMNCLFLETSYNLAENRIVAGNPDLDPEMTQIFEVGIRHFIDRTTELSLAAYYKDITGLVNTKDHSEGTYYVFSNDDSHGMVRGIEATLNRRAGSNISGQISYALSIAKGKYSSMLEGYNYAQMGVLYISNEDNYLDWDQTHTVSASIEVRSFESEGPEVAGIHPLENTRLGISWNYGSGMPYTLPPVEAELVETNTERYPFSTQTDIVLSRMFSIGSTELNLVLGVFNLFNRKNIVHIYDTSLFHTSGDPGGSTGNARAWSPARHFILSAGISW